jgi:hypothetical protein
VSADPIGQFGGLLQDRVSAVIAPALMPVLPVNSRDTNLYAYSMNSPLRRFDPLGLWSATYSAYFGGGVSFTKGSDENGDFWTLTVGFGFGGGYSFDPNGKFIVGDDDFEERCPNGYGYVGGTWGANAGWGPASWGSNSDLGKGWAPRDEGYGAQRKDVDESSEGGEIEFSTGWNAQAYIGIKFGSGGNKNGSTNAP